MCTGHPGSGSCGRVNARVHIADDHVRGRLLEALENPDIVARLTRPVTTDIDLHERIRADEDTLEELSKAFWVDGEMTRAEWRAAREPIEARLEAARARVARAPSTTALTEFVGTYEQMSARWEAMNASQRRAVVTAAIELITVAPAPRRGSRRYGYDAAARFGAPVWRL